MIKKIVIVIGLLASPQIFCMDQAILMPQNEPQIKIGSKQFFASYANEQIKAALQYLQDFWKHLIYPNMKTLMDKNPEVFWEKVKNQLDVALKQQDTQGLEGLIRHLIDDISSKECYRLSYRLDDLPELYSLAKELKGKDVFECEEQQLRTALRELAPLFNEQIAQFKKSASGLKGTPCLIANDFWKPILLEVAQKKASYSYPDVTWEVIMAIARYAVSKKSYPASGPAFDVIVGKLSQELLASHVLFTQEQAEQALQELEPIFQRIEETLDKNPESIVKFNQVLNPKLYKVSCPAFFESLVTFVGFDLHLQGFELPQDKHKDLPLFIQNFTKKKKEFIQLFQWQRSLFYNMWANVPVQPFSKAQVEVTLKELTPLFRFLENPKNLSKDNVSQCIGTLLAMLNTSTHHFTHREVVHQIAFFVAKIEYYFICFGRGYLDASSVLTALAKDRKAFALSCTHAVPLIERIVQQCAHTLVFSWVVEQLPKEMDIRGKDLIRAWLNTPIVRRIPIHRVFGLLRNLPLDFMITCAQSGIIQPLSELLGPLLSEFIQNNPDSIPENMQPVVGMAALFMPTILGYITEYPDILILVRDLLEAFSHVEESEASKGLLARILGDAVPEAVQLKFPICVGDCKTIYYRDLAQAAQRGNFELIEKFTKNYGDHKDCKDEKNHSLLYHAIIGYCNGSDAAWKVFAHLVNEGLVVSQDIQEYLNSQANGDVERKGYIREAFEERTNFVLETPFISSEPPKINKGGNGAPCIIS